MSKQFTNQDIATMIDIYNIYKNITKTAYALSLSPITVRKYLRLNKIPVYLSHKRYNYIWNLTELERGYICGLIASDGNLSKTDSAVSIALINTDQDTLFHIGNLLVSNGIKLYKNKNNAVLSITHKDLHKYCLDMGITPAKSLTLDVKLDDKSEDFKCAFLRGVIDGDGSVHVGKDLSRCNIRIFSASEAFLITLKAEFGGSLYSRINNLYNDKPIGLIYVLEYNAKNVLNLCKKMPNLEWMLKRKSIRIEGILKKVYGNGKYIIAGTEDTVTSLHKKLGSENKLSTIYGRIKRGWNVIDAVSLPKNAFGDGRFKSK